MRDCLCSLRGIGTIHEALDRSGTIKYSDQQNYVSHAFDSSRTEISFCLSLWQRRHAVSMLADTAFQIGKPFCSAGFICNKLFPSDQVIWLHDGMEPTSGIKASRESGFGITYKWSQGVAVIHFRASKDIVCVLRFALAVANGILLCSMRDDWDAPFSKK